MSQQGGQTRATLRQTMLRLHVAIVLPGVYNTIAYVGNGRNVSIDRKTLGKD